MPVALPSVVAISERVRAAPARAAGGARAEPAPAGRYRIRGRGREAYLACLEAPTVRVRIERGFCASPAQARGSPPGTIFLDGAARGEPFLDPARAVYNLDHHEGCVRPFTLATCEQALVLLLRGLDLRRREWTIHANDADLDTLLAIWVLANHVRLSEDTAARARVLPLLRLQGTIDAQGLELAELCALPRELFAATRARMEALRAREVELRARGKWGDVDLLDYVAERLHAIDQWVYAGEDLDRAVEIEELARVEIGGDSIAVVCRSPAGIYEVEGQLRRIHGGRAGLIALEQGAGRWTLRQLDPNLPATLDRLYERLNLLDGAAGGSRSSQRWGGSAEIGGSPRRGSTRLDAAAIANACRLAYRGPAPGQRLRASAHAAAAAIGLALLAVLASEVTTRWIADRTLAYACAFAGAATLLFTAAAARSAGLAGLRRPVGAGAWLLFPPALLGAISGGVPLPSLAPGVPAARELLPLAAWVLGCELGLRGVVHGVAALALPIQTRSGPWFLSQPALLSGALHALLLALLLAAGLGGAAASPPLAQLATVFTGAMVLGTCAAMARERSESILAPLAIHALGAGAALATALLGR
jgi:hypothetical protein